MKQQLIDVFQTALSALQQQSILPNEQKIEVKFERPKQREQGDFATNIAMVLSKIAKRNPRELAELIIENLPKSENIVQVNVAGPGFINVYLRDAVHQEIIAEVLKDKSQFGTQIPKKKKKILIEFVSANPTGPLHVGHGRGAAYGDSLAKLLAFAGHEVVTEYYVNDAGRQMHILATSLWLRYLQNMAVDFTFPEQAYKGDYLQVLATNLFEKHADQFAITGEFISSAQTNLDAEKSIDAVILLAKKHLADNYALFFDCALVAILEDIKVDLSGFGVEFDQWASEKAVVENDKINAMVALLAKSGYAYQQDGNTAWWFRSSEFGDEKDRVLIRANGVATYFAADAVYHVDKIQRGFDECINIWGSDHHGYIPRIKAVLSALDYDADTLKVLLVQFATLYKNKQKMKMSTRSGEFVTLRELREEVGKDAARFFYVQRKSEQHLDFDLDLATSKSNENPVFYVQYAHARIASIFAQANARNISIDIEKGVANVGLLNSELEKRIMVQLQKFPEVVSTAANQYEPHQVSFYLRELATSFHAYYNQVKFLDADAESINVRFSLLSSIQQVLKNGLALLAVSAPEKM